MRNRGYKYVIKKNGYGYLLMCINATWINHMLKERGIRPRDFRKLTYEDLAAVQSNELRRNLFLELQPKNFWQMCDTLALAYAEYDTEPGHKIYEYEWFHKNPVFAVEDVYEILLDRGFQQEDALRVSEFARRGKCSMLKLNNAEFLQLYDVPEDMQAIIKRCKYIPHRDRIMQLLLDSIERAAYVAKMREARNKESI